MFLMHGALEQVSDVMLDEDLTPGELQNVMEHACAWAGCSQGGMDKASFFRLVQYFYDA